MEAEVARRLEEREREWAREEEARREEDARRWEEARRAEKRKGKEPASQESLPSGTLTPLLRRQEDLDSGALKKRLEELEQKL